MRISSIVAAFLSVASAFEAPWASNCQTGTGVTAGFRLGDGCKPSPIVTPVFCATNERGFAIYQNEACVRQESEINEVETYTRTVTDSREHADLMSVVARAEGKAFGVRVSASTEYMESTTVGESSVMYVIGSSIKYGNDYVEFDQDLQLIPSAAAQLRNNPAFFLEQYGDYYVSGVQKGGSFFASVNINERSSSNSGALNVFASISTPFGGGSGGYESAFENHHSHMDIQAEGRRTGGGLIPGHGSDERLVFDAKNTSYMATLHDDWFRSISANNAKELMVTYKPWINIRAVADIVHALSPEEQKLFFVDEIVAETYRRYQESRILLARAQSSVATAMQWACVADPDMREFRQKLVALGNSISGELGKLQGLSEFDMRVIQQEGTYDENFTGYARLFEFADLVHDYGSLCGIAYGGWGTRHCPEPSSVLNEQQCRAFAEATNSSFSIASEPHITSSRPAGCGQACWLRGSVIDYSCSVGDRSVVYNHRPDPERGFYNVRPICK